MSAPAGVISGVVRDAAGDPVAGARVAFTDGPRPLPDIAALTDGEGHFSLAAPAEGTYTLACRTDDGTASAAVHITGRGLRPAGAVVELRLG
ncbi:carboxypeptidase-like regulatory domain-containing protein [Streptomyces sp. NPDC046215]|uniref:Carboxypeptidase regulatory-like domain-containing protein n=1 Tax=Streptomyces stramineus TaxID=173861 RepID=A0ABP3KQ01_9ACTN